MKNNTAGNGKRKISLKAKYAVVLIVLASVPALIVSMGSYIYMVNQSYASIDKEIDNAVSEIDLKVGTTLAGLSELNSSIVKLDLIKYANGKITSYVNLKPDSTDGKVKMDPDSFGMEEKRIYDMMKSFVTAFSSIPYMTLATEADGGIVMYPEKNRTPGYDARTRSWYKNCAESRDNQVLSDMYISSLDDITLEITDKIILDGKLQGVFSTSVDLSYIKDIAAQKNIGKTGFIIITDKTEAIVAHPNNPEAVSKNISSLGEGYAEILKNETEKTVYQTIGSKKYALKIIDSSNKNLGWKYISILNAMIEQNEGSGLLLQAVSNIAAVTDEVKNGSSEMLMGSNKVLSEMKNLTKATEKITFDMSEIASGVVQINNAVSEINGIAQKNKSGADNLFTEVNKFKLK